MTLKSYQFILLNSLLQFVLFSFPFLKNVWATWYDYTFILVSCIMIIVINIIIFTILLNRWTNKLLPSLLLLTSALSLYFINNYGIFIDKIMIANVIETNKSEATELFNRKLIIYVMIFGALPGYLLSYIDIDYGPFIKELSYKVYIIATCFLILIITGASSERFIRVVKPHKGLKSTIIPINYLLAVTEYALMIKNTQSEDHLIPIATDATREDSIKPKLIILIVGEAARAQNFSLNGYSRNTNEPLEYDLINFTNFYSCGTSTSISVPCMFSHLSRKDFNLSKAKSHHNLLDVLTNTGIKVSWIENDGGCKGICNRIPNHTLECHDDLMIKDIEPYISSNNNNLIVLHQRGSHGPNYNLRVPEKFQKFSPICETGNLDKCTYEEIIGSYDNTIYYTSYVLNEVIKLTNTYSNDFDTAVIYMSDHGESLGERGIYLHGTPYFMAPDEQKHIPAMMWLSSNFIENNNLKYSCLENKQDNTLSHDYLFHTILGIFHIKTKIYDEKLDLLQTCR